MDCCAFVDAVEALVRVATGQTAVERSWRTTQMGVAAEKLLLVALDEEPGKG